MSATWPLQVAMVARLKATPGVTALLGANPNTRVYDGRAPQGALKPYVVVGSQTSGPNRYLGGLGSDETVTAHVFSSYDGNKEALAIEAALDAAFVAPLTVTGFGTVILKPTDRPGVLVEETGRHAPVVYRAVAWAA